MSEKPNLKPRITISMDDDVLLRLDTYAQKNGVSRAGAVSVLVNFALNSLDSMNAVKELQTMMDKLTEIAKIVEENEVKTSEIEK